MTPFELACARDKLATELAKLDASIAEHAAAHRSERIVEVHALMSAHSLTMSDIGQPKLASVGTRKKLTVAQKYLDPKTGSTWTGRGRRPLWFVAATCAGASLESLKVVAQTSTAEDKIAA